MVEKSVRTGEQVKHLRIKSASVAVLALAAMAICLSCGGDDQSSEITPRRLPAVTVRSELLGMMYDQQHAREVLDSVVAESGWTSSDGQAAVAESARIDSASQARLKEIVEEFGWPGRSLVGEEAAIGAFLILQNADLSLQQQYLPLLRAAAEQGEAMFMQLAMLQDRILKRQDQPQRYGTQLWNDPSTGELGLYPVEDSANVDVRRDSVGLGPLDGYLRDMGINPDTMTPPIEIIVSPSEK